MQSFKTIAFIAAMQEELDQLIAVVPKEDIKTDNENKLNISIINYHGISIIAALSGVGKVNAAMTTTILLMKYKPDLVINVGVAGGFDANQKILDFAIAESFIYTDVDITNLGFLPGQLLNEPQIFPADKECVNAVKSLENDFDSVKFHYGLLGSSDKFICRKDQVDEISSKFPNVICVEMEGAAIAHVCYKFNVPLLAIRSLSDIAVIEHDNTIDFSNALLEASKSAAKLSLAFINKCSVIA